MNLTMQIMLGKYHHFHYNCQSLLAALMHSCKQQQYSMTSTLTLLLGLPEVSHDQAWQATVNTNLSFNYNFIQHKEAINTF